MEPQSFSLFTLRDICHFLLARGELLIRKGRDKVTSNRLVWNSCFLTPGVQRTVKKRVEWFYLSFDWLSPFSSHESRPIFFRLLRFTLLGPSLLPSPVRNVVRNLSTFEKTTQVFHCPMGCLHTSCVRWNWKVGQKVGNWLRPLSSFSQRTDPSYYIDSLNN